MALNEFKSSNVTADQRSRMIAKAAYFRAERRGFQNGDAATDWIEAEAEIDYLLNAGEGGFGQSDTKRSYQEMFEAQLEDWDKKLEEVTIAAKKAGTKLRNELDSRLVDLTEQRAAARTQLAQLREHGEETWQDLRENADGLWEDLRGSLNEMMSRLKVSDKRESEGHKVRVK